MGGLRARGLLGVRMAISLAGLPPRVARFYWRARREAIRAGEDWNVHAAARPPELSALLKLARGTHLVVELGTGPAWTAISLALADPHRRVVTYDPVEQPQRQRLLELAGADARSRIEFVEGPGSEGTAAPGSVGLLFIDSSHERDETVVEFHAWRKALAPGAVVAFHDYEHTQYPGVADAVRELGLHGVVEGGMFVWRAP